MGLTELWIPPSLALHVIYASLLSFRIKGLTDFSLTWAAWRTRFVVGDYLAIFDEEPL